MSKEFDTSWFKLDKYDGLNDLDLFGWYSLINTRYWIHNCFNDLFYDPYCNDSDKAKILNRINECIKENPIEAGSNVDREQWRIENYGELKYPFNTYSVQSATASDMNYMGTHELLDDVWRTIEAEDDCPTEQGLKLMMTPYDILLRDYQREHTHWSQYADTAHIRIDLSATDEQIKKDFNHWLSEYRKVVGYESRDKKFTEKNLGDWIKWRLLPYIDLTFIAKFEEKDITHVKAAGLIFPDEYDTDRVERIRRTTKPKSEWLMSNETISAIELQIASLPRR